MSKKIRLIMAVVAISLISIILILIGLPYNLHSDTLSTGVTKEVPALGPIAARPEAIDLEFSTPSGLLKRIRDLKGQVVYLNFWATWCEPCLKEIPLIEKLQTETAHFTAVMVNMDHNSLDHRKAARFCGRRRRMWGWCFQAAKTCNPLLILLICPTTS
jgi:thiol-disulfide isomerase/thioredoxin